MPEIALFHVDAFTSTPFRGNPAAVVLLEQPAPESWMQAVAAEMNLSETAFIAPAPHGYSLRWFTPTVEVELCGHATLAAAHVLWSEGLSGPERLVEFSSASGVLRCERLEDGDIRLDFPSDEPAPAPAPSALTAALGIAATEVQRGRFDYLVRVERAEQVQALAPEFALLATVEARGVSVTAPSDTAGVDFVSRFFGPRAGIPEDPVTGSAHCMLGPYWRRELGDRPFRAVQASPRGGEMTVEVSGDRVLLSGCAVTIARGTLSAHP